MAKKQTTFKLRLDVMSITVLLVIAIFGGVLGYYIGQTTGINLAVQMLQNH
jgi:hypothetical protein